MKKISGKLIKKLRDELNLSQEQFAEKINISTRQLSRLENEQAKTDIFHFLEILKIFNQPPTTVQSLLFESQSMAEFENYKKLTGVFAINDWATFNELTLALEGNSLMKSPYIKQLLAYAEILQAEQARKTPTADFNKEDFEKLHQVMCMTINYFDEEKVADYLLTPHEVYLIGDMCTALLNAGEDQRAIRLAKALVKNRNTQPDSSGNNYLYTYATTVLSECYYKTNRVSELLVEMTALYNYCIKEKIFNNISTILEAIANCYKLLGEEEAMYKPYLVRSYHWAKLRRNQRDVEGIKLYAKEKYDIILEN